MTEIEITKYIEEKVTWSNNRKENPGGQHTNGISSDVICICEDLDIKISIHYSRLQLENKAIALLAMQQAIREIFNKN